MSSILISIASNCAATCCTTCLCESCKCVSNSIGSKLSRHFYSIHFFVVMVIAFILRDHGQELINKIPWIITQLLGQPSQIWYGQYAVNRISFSSFLYFGSLSFLTNLAKKKKKINFKIQNQYWIVKFFFWIILCFFSFLISNKIINYYYYLSYLGSIIFLLIQDILFIDFLYLTNEKLLNINNNYGLYFMSISSIFCFISSMSIIIYLHQNFSNEKCILNNLFLIITLVLNTIYSTLTFLPHIEHASIFPSSIMFLYNLYLCYTSLISQPMESICYHSESIRQNDNSEFMLYFGVVSTMASIIYSSFRIGSISKNILPSNNQKLLIDESEIKLDMESKENNEIIIEYNYSFFHFIFSLGSMYIVTLYNGWDKESNIIIGSGWTNVWIKIINSWVLSLLYIWTLIAPAICKSRVFN